MLSWKCYNCERCGSDFASPTALKQHFRARHAGKEMCDRCGSEVEREKLQEHEQVAHYEETHGAQKPLVRAAPLRRESRFLASETSVTCRMCRRAFGTSFGREQHERQDHHFTASKRARMSTGFSPNNIVDMRSSQQLRQFVETRLRPESGLMKTACAGEVEALVELIEQCCPVPVSRVVKGGSFIKGTDTQDWSDVDAVLFSDSFTSLEDCRRSLTPALAALEKNLKNTAMTNRILMEKKTAFALRFQFKCFNNTHSHHFDVMLCYDTLGPRPSKDDKGMLFRRLCNCGHSDEAQLLSLSLLQYQVDFVKAATLGVKDLIRLVKHWFRTSFAKPSQENRFRRLPSSYTVELLTLHAWQLAGKPIFFSLLQGLRAVLRLLLRCSELCILWDELYTPYCQGVRRTLQEQTRPFILDPANPTFNVCENCNAWDEVAVVARQSLLKPLLNGVQASGPWLLTDSW